MKKHVLLIEDDQKLAELTASFLEDNGYSVSVALTGNDGLEQQQEHTHDLIVLDIMLPDIDGLEVCRILRSSDRTPIIMLTAKGDPTDKIVGLELGADDYLAKPFEPRELLARMRAVLRRASGSEESEKLTFGRLEIDRNSMEVSLDGAKCSVTAYQFRILEVLALASGRVLSRTHLMNELQGHDFDAFDRSIDVHISRIRAEIEDDPKEPRRILTVRGAGYVFARKQD